MDIQIVLGLTVVDLTQLTVESRQFEKSKILWMNRGISLLSGLRCLISGALEGHELYESPLIATKLDLN